MRGSLSAELKFLSYILNKFTDRKLLQLRFYSTMLKTCQLKKLTGQMPHLVSLPESCCQIFMTVL